MSYELIWQDRIDSRAELITAECRCILLRGKTAVLHNPPAAPVRRGPSDVALEILRHQDTQQALASFDAGQSEAGALLHQAVIDAVEVTLQLLAADICAAAEKLERKRS